MVTNQVDNAGQGGEQRYRHLFENAPICILVVDLTLSLSTILEVNRRAALVFGYPAAEMVRMPAAELMPDNAGSAFWTTVQRVQQGETVLAETICKRRDGTHFPARIIAAPDPTEAGYMLVTVEDITTEKQRRTEAQAIEAERRRIAHEIHDGVAQSLAGLRFKSALWSHRAATAPPEMRAALDELLVVLTTAIADLRRAIFALRPLDLEELGFFPALRQLLSESGDYYQFVTRLEQSGPENDLPAAYELALFRVIQEGLNNIGQHSRASSVLVRLAVEAVGAVAVTVRDNGCGFDPQQIAPAGPLGHYGLWQMRERILDLGGTLDVHSAPGRGTTLLITLPPAAVEVTHAAD